MFLTLDKANKVYDILVKYGRALESERSSFLDSHIEYVDFHNYIKPFTNQYDCKEWRFQGVLGFGGKYRSDTNTVDCYWEDEDPIRLHAISVINDELSKLE